MLLAENYSANHRVMLKTGSPGYLPESQDQYNLLVNPFLEYFGDTRIELLVLDRHSSSVHPGSGSSRAQCKMLALI